MLKFYIYIYIFFFSHGFQVYSNLSLQIVKCFKHEAIAWAEVERDDFPKCTCLRGHLSFWLSVFPL